MREIWQSTALLGKRLQVRLIRLPQLWHRPISLCTRIHRYKRMKTAQWDAWGDSCERLQILPSGLRRDIKPRGHAVYRLSAELTNDQLPGTSHHWAVQWHAFLALAEHAPLALNHMFSQQTACSMPAPIHLPTPLASAPTQLLQQIWAGTHRQPGYPGSSLNGSIAPSDGPAL